MKSLGSEVRKISNAISLQEKIVNNIIKEIDYNSKPKRLFAVPRKGKQTDISLVIKALGRSKRGVSLETIQDKTGFAKAKINNHLQEGIRSNRIARKGRGVYCRLLG